MTTAYAGCASRAIRARHTGARYDAAPTRPRGAAAGGTTYGSGHGTSTGPSGASRRSAPALAAAVCTTARTSQPPSGAGAALTTTPQAWSPNPGPKTRVPAAAEVASVWNPNSRSLG